MLGQTLKVAVHKEMFPNTLRDLGLSTRMWFKGCMVSSKPIDGSLPKYLFVVSLHLFLLQAANSIRNAIVKEEVLEPGDCFPKVAPMSPRGGGPGSPKPQPKEVGDEGETQPGSPDELKSKSKDQEFQHMERSSDTHQHVAEGAAGAKEAELQGGVSRVDAPTIHPPSPSAVPMDQPGHVVSGSDQRSSNTPEKATLLAGVQSPRPSFARPPPSNPTDFTHELNTRFGGNDNGYDPYYTPESMPPAPLSDSAVYNRLWRVFRRRKDGKYALDEKWVEAWNDAKGSGRDEVKAIFEKVGYNPDKVQETRGKSVFVHAGAKNTLQITMMQI